MHINADSLNTLWLRVLDLLIEKGAFASPRGQETLEVCPLSLTLTDSLNNILTIPGRKLNYSFMVAEWFWIACGRDDVESIAHYNKEISRFSDDGQTYFGAYGPRIAEQRSYVVRKLREDPDSRQAVITTWRPSPPGTRDVPCTIAFQYLLRGGRLISNVTMRSSDAWLGLPYDVFNFARLQAQLAFDLGVSPGQLSLFLGSSHIYGQHLAPAKAILRTYGTRYQHTDEWRAVPAGRSPLLSHTFRQNMSAIEQVARATGRAMTEFGAPWTDYAEALAYRTHRDITRGGGHVMRLVREVAKLNQITDEVNHVKKEASDDAA